MAKEKWMNVICPICSAWKNKPCKHTKGSKRGKQRSEPHSDRVRLAKVKLSREDQEKIARISDDYKKTSLTKKNPKEKLTTEQKEVVETLSNKIDALNRHAEFIAPVTVGPIVSTYRFFPVRHTKVAHLEAMSKDFAVSLGSDDNVLVKRMPGESAVGVFVPNKHRKPVLFQDTLENVSEWMANKPADGHKPLPLNFGIDSNGVPFVDDLTQLPHLLVAGSTGSGKSTFLHGVVETLCWTMKPTELKLIISDTKGVEFKAFKEVPHLLRSDDGNLIPPATDVYQTMGVLTRAVDETQRRLDMFAIEDVRNIHDYNAKVPVEKQFPYWVILIDELFDILGKPDRNEAKANSKKIEEIVGRSRASGIYMIAATQRPSAGLVKGQIKANFPARASFRLPAWQDSKTVLNTKGAENLMMKGDMLYIGSTPDMKRLHAPYTSLQDTKDMVTAIIQREKDEQERRNKQYAAQKAEQSELRVN